MIDREKVIADLRKFINYPEPLSVIVKKALELLKEQEPVRPQVLIDTWICGNCKTRLERQSMIGPNVLMDENFYYCPCCGKKVKWDEQ